MLLGRLPERAALSQLLPRRPRSQDPGPTAQLLRRADRRDPV